MFTRSPVGTSNWSKVAPEHLCSLLFVKQDKSKKYPHDIMEVHLHRTVTFQGRCSRMSKTFNIDLYVYRLMLQAVRWLLLDHEAFLKPSIVTYDTTFLSVLVGSIDIFPPQFINIHQNMYVNGY